MSRGTSAANKVMKPTETAILLAGSHCRDLEGDVLPETLLPSATEQQSRRSMNSQPAGSTGRERLVERCMGFKSIRIGAKVSLHPRRHLQHLQCRNVI